jgi:hypothetical protein
MSAAHDDHGHDHAFTGEPTDELPADEPRTPGWLTALGIALFTLGAVVLVAGRGDAQAQAQAAGAESASAAAAPVAPPTTATVVRPAATAPTPAPTLARAAPPPARGAPTGAPTLPNGMTPEAAERIRKALAGAQKKLPGQ